MIDFVCLGEHVVPFIWLPEINADVEAVLTTLLVDPFVSRYRYVVFRCDHADPVTLAPHAEKFQWFRQCVLAGGARPLFVANNKDVEYLLTHVGGVKEKEVIPTGTVIAGTIDKWESERPSQ